MCYSIWDTGLESSGSLRLPFFCCFFQSVSLLLPLVVLSLAGWRSARYSRLVAKVVAGVCCVYPLAIFVDQFVFVWIGVHVHSLLAVDRQDEFSRVLPFVGLGSIKMVATVAVCSLVTPLVVFLSTRACLSTIRKCIPSSQGHVFALVFPCGFLVLSSATWIASPSLDHGRVNSAGFQPFRVFGFVKHSETLGQSVSGAANFESADARDVGERPDFIEVRQRRLNLAAVHSQQNPNSLPDVLVIVIESLRPEVVSEGVMPNVSELKRQSLQLEQHFSGGNATNHGLFCLFSGMEPIWFNTPQRYQSNMCRWLGSIGYHRGFFAGADDWGEFLMDGFINSEHYDEFETLPRNGIDSDRRTIELATAFLDRKFERRSEIEDGAPLFAVVYLYGTHATYQSYPQDQLNQPAADDRYPFPYPSRLRDQVWNRYCNSARTIDRMLKPLLKPDRVVMLLGDHGESFLEDGSIGHGTQLSRVPNMTASFIHSPGMEPRKITTPTMHADLLPTLLTCLNVELSDPRAIDGVSLVSAGNPNLLQRCFSTRNYLQADYALIGPWTVEEPGPFAIRCELDLATGDVKTLNAIDEVGLDVETAAAQWQVDQVRHWKNKLMHMVPE